MGEHKTETLDLYIKGAGCLTNCRHCWADGGRYPNMPFDEMKNAAERIRNFCQQNDLGFFLCVMHEVLAHPDALRILKMEDSVNPAKTFCNVIPTSGIAFAVRKDYRELLAGLKELGHNVLWFSLHGIGEVHDEAVGRHGAFEELKLVISRIKEAGLGFGFNVFLTKPSIAQLPEITEFLHDVGIEKASVEIPDYCPVKRWPEYDKSRVEYGDVAPLLDKIREICLPSSMKVFEHLEEYTEAALVKKALESGEDGLSLTWKITSPQDYPLTCDAAGNLFAGCVDALGKRFGNLLENPDKTLESLQEDLKHHRLKKLHSPAFYYPGRTIPPIETLAKNYGDPNGQKIYPWDIAWLWLDKAFGKTAEK